MIEGSFFFWTRSWPLRTYSWTVEYEFSAPFIAGQAAVGSSYVHDKSVESAVARHEGGGEEGRRETKEWRRRGRTEILNLLSWALVLKVFERVMGHTLLVIQDDAFQNKAKCLTTCAAFYVLFLDRL